MLLLFLACNGDKTADTQDVGLPTPEEVVASAADGETVHFAGTVHTLSFDSSGAGSGDDGEDNWSQLPGRWLLVRSAVPEGISWDETELADAEDDDAIALAWTLGIALPDDAEAPRIGETVEVQGTFRDTTWNGHPVPVIEAPEILSRSGSPLAATGEACALDADCGDDLVCDRASLSCAAPASTDWGSLWRDVDGHCYSDDDCPLGQWCDTSFVVPDSGDYTWRYDGSSKTGASLCVAEDLVDPSIACGRIDADRDLAGGRPIEGKEVCIQGKVMLVVPANDGDSHVQLYVDEPLPYPWMDAPIRLFGGTTEIGPPHKNPDRPQGALADPEMGEEIIALGTIRWDPGHGWFEVHPVKQWWPVEGR